MPVEVPRKKAFASSSEQSELLTSNLASLYKLGKKHKCPFTGGGAVDARERNVQCVFRCPPVKCPSRA